MRGNERAILIRVASESSESAERGESELRGGGIGGGLVEQGADEGRVCGLFGSGDSLDAKSAVGDAPLLDEAAERVVWD